MTTTIQTEPSTKASINVRRKLAAERQATREKLSPSQQLAVLDSRLGVGVGAVKERARLQRILTAPAKQPPKQPEVAAETAAVPMQKAEKKGSKKKFKQQ